MEENNQSDLKQLALLNNLVQDWSDESNQDPNTLNELLLEFDLIVNQIKDRANNSNEIEIENICELFLNNLVIFYEDTITTKQIELICAWPFYISDFISNHEDENTKLGLEEFLKDSDWPEVYRNEDEAITDIPFHDESQELNSDNLNDNNTSISNEQKEFLDLINAEIIDIQEQNTLRLTELANSTDSNEAELSEEIDTQLDQLDRIGSAADMIGLQGLKKFCKQININLAYFKENDIQKFHVLIKHFLVWPDIIQAYLFAPEDSEYILAALDYLNLDFWPIQLTPVEQKYFEEAFYTSKVEVENNKAPDRLREANLEDINLNKPDDVPVELFDSLLQDLPEQTAEFSLAVQNLRNSDYLNQLETSKRIAHTLKGAGNTVGIQGLANLTHHLEDILEALLKEHEKPTLILHNVLENAADCLEEMSEYLHGMGAAPKDALKILQEILNWANYIDENGVPNESDAESSNDPSLISESQTSTKIDEVEIPETIKEIGKENKSEQSLRITTTLVDDLLKQAGENIISNAQLQEYISQSKYSAKQLRINNNKIKNLADELEHLIEVRGFASRFSSNNKLDKFDPLEMDQFNELNTYANLLIEAAADSYEIGMNIESSLFKLDDLSSNQKRILLDNQETVLRTRMVPVKSILQRLRRSVKQANKISSKNAQLHIVGENILVDSDILNQLVDPLMHILRNAVDHGIESSEMRVKHGKDENGIIELHFAKKGKQIIISCEDNGCGLDIDRIKSKALESNLLHEEEEFKKEDALKLILQHGFSTKNNVSQLSGRGVGLDVVFSEVRALKGSMFIDTTQGKGTKIELSIPITFHSTQALLVTCKNNTLAISSRGVEEILHPGAGGVTYKNDKPFFTYKQKHYPIFDLHNVLFKTDARISKISGQAILIVKDEFSKSHAILIDKILDSREIVVKPFSRFIPKMTGLLGSTIIGDGSVISVIDLLDIVNITEPSITSRRSNTDKHMQEETKHCVLIVEDAISTRKSLAQFMQDLNYKVETAKDGVEAIDKIQTLCPSIILTDLEMPRMNGLELTDHLRSNEETKNIPIIMITSRATDKHKKEAQRIGVSEYMTKPYDEDQLLNYINKLTVSV